MEAQWADFDPPQAQYHQRWQHLRDPDVRALAWLLDSPDLFDANWLAWQGKIAQVSPMPELDAWLTRLDLDPAALKSILQPHMRLGRYAEKLMGFYLQQQGVLVAQGLPVRAGKNDTVGEFDFLWRDGLDLVHWEFATKFYLFEASIGAQGIGYFVGPNLADSLDLKMGKILHRQLALGQHPAAQALLPQPIDRAQALVKGWLFYRDPALLAGSGLSPRHCRGFWCTPHELASLPGQRFTILPRKNWLAPAALVADFEVLSHEALLPLLQAHFANDSMPLLLACLALVNGQWLETRRGFIVPDDWQQRAAQRYPVGQSMPML